MLCSSLIYILLISVKCRTLLVIPELKILLASLNHKQNMYYFSIFECVPIITVLKSIHST